VRSLPVCVCGCACVRVCLRHIYLGIDFGQDILIKAAITKQNEDHNKPRHNNKHTLARGLSPKIYSAVNLVIVIKII